MMPITEDIKGTIAEGAISGQIIMVIEYKPAPPTPCAARNPMSCSRLVQKPQAKDAARKKKKDMHKTVFLPKTSDTLAMATVNPRISTNP